MTVVVTGALGFLGSNVVRALAASGTDVVAVDRREPDEVAHGYLAGVAGHVTHVQGDVSAADWAGPAVPADAVIHAAAATPMGPEDEARGAGAAASVNVTGTANVVAWAISAGVRRIVVVSSAAVYGPALGLAGIDESTPPAPDTVYGITKLAGERLAGRLADLAGSEFVVARCSHLFGPMERPSPSRARLSPVHGWVNALLVGEPMQTATARLARDFLYVVDAAEALLAMLSAPLGAERVFNVASGTSLTDAEALAVLAALDPSSRTVVADRGEIASRPPLRIDRMEAWAGWAPRFDFAAGCRDYVAWRRSGAVA